MQTKVAHITIVSARPPPGRNGCWTQRRAPATRHNLCGAEPGLWDVRERDARTWLRKMGNVPLVPEGNTLCPVCLRLAELG